MTSSFGMGSHQATLEEDVTLGNGQTSSSLTGRTSGLPQGQLGVAPSAARLDTPIRTSGGGSVPGWHCHSRMWESMCARLYDRRGQRRSHDALGLSESVNIQELSDLALP